MTRINIQWVPPTELLSFPEIAEVRGYYLDVLTGDVFRNAGHFTEANRKILEAHTGRASGEALGRKAFLFLTADLDASIEDVKRLASEQYRIPREQLGKLVHSLE